MRPGALASITVTVMSTNVDSDRVDGYSNCMHPWTLDELTRRVDDVLARDQVRQDNGQVAQAPNARTVRWYQSTGLLRRPDQRGRVAFYGVAHLAELVAIKRLQANGLSLADVQSHLQGLDDDGVFALAALPADAIVNVDIAHDVSADFWGTAVEDAVVIEPAPTVTVTPATSTVSTATRVGVEHDGFTLLLPAGSAASPDVVAALLRDLVARLVDGSPSMSTSVVVDDATAKESE